MVEYLIGAALVLICGLWRLTDGGYHRLPGSNVIGWLLPSVIVGGLTFNPYLAAAALLLGRQWTQGFENWGSYGEQTLRNSYALLFGLAVLLIDAWELADVDNLWVGIGVGAVAVTNVIQPWTRARFDGHFSNRQAEFVEGLGVGIAAVSVAL